ncbi:MAG TPA: DUF2785 domain-containing protein [Xanthomonadaceae bacterium]|jgi:hypothetical protein|nr:DUF2785 domain-containing protein [Xanthomonadaceae bacterium]
MRNSMGWSLALLMAPMFLLSPAHAACPPDGQTTETLQTLKALKFEMSDVDARKKLAQGLVACLGNPDPVIRDDIAYSALMTWMRANDFDGDTLGSMRDALYAQLDGNDEPGFRRSYTALVLSEVARTDRIKPWMTPEDRAAMVEKAASYVESVSDYRGFDDKDGWRHAIAHGADWLMQLALNPALERAQTDRILDAVAAQAVPDAAPAYVFGESGRLARPVIYVAQRAFYSEADWTKWFNKLLPKIGDPALAYRDSHWLARRHDLMAFLMSLYIEVDQSEDPNIHQLKPVIVATVKSVP